MLFPPTFTANLKLPSGSNYSWTKVPLVPPVDGFDSYYRKSFNDGKTKGKTTYRHPALEQGFNVTDLTFDMINPAYFVHPCFESLDAWSRRGKTFDMGLAAYKRPPDEYNPAGMAVDVSNAPCKDVRENVRWKYKEDGYWSTTEISKKDNTIFPDDFNEHDDYYNGWPSHAILSEHKFGMTSLKMKTCPEFSRPGAYSYEPPWWAVNAMILTIPYANAAQPPEIRIIFYAYFNPMAMHWIRPTIGGQPRDSTAQFKTVIQQIYRGAGIMDNNIKYSNHFDYNDLSDTLAPYNKAQPGGSRKLRRRSKTSESQTRKSKQLSARKNKTYKNKSRKRRNTTS